MLFKAKLRYDPIELDPEEMCRMASEQPQVKCADVAWITANTLSFYAERFFISSVVHMNQICKISTKKS